jgi:ABC-type branched-subunit amino acid transport system substrate-binding protein
MCERLAMTKRILIVVACTGCSGGSTCSVDADCASGAVCELRGDHPVCVPASEAKIVIGQGLALSGPNQGQGIAVQAGVELAFDEANAAGGIRGRKVEIDFVDDSFQPDVAESVARTMVDAQVSADAPKCPSTAAVSATAISRGPSAVLALLGNVGAPTSQRVAAIAAETGTVYFGAVTGAAALLRDDEAGACARYLFNVRASHAEEARATLELFLAKGVVDHRHLVSFDQDDSYGDSGYTGLVAAYLAAVGPFPSGTDPTTPIARFRYTRNDDTSVPAQAVAAEDYLAQLLTDTTGTVVVGVMMTDTYGAAGTFVDAIRHWQFQNDAQQTTLQKATRLKLMFSNISLVEANALSDRLIAAPPVQTPGGPMSLTDSVYVSQVVPNYATDPSALVAAYRSAIAGHGTPAFLSLEGYLVARVFLAALAAHDGPFTPDGLVDSLEQQTSLDVGLPGDFGFAPDRHQYSNEIWGTALEADGTFRAAYVWREGTPIQLLP